MKDLQLRKTFFGLSHISGAPTLILGTPGSARKSRRLVALWLAPLFDDHDSTNLFSIVSLCNDCLCTNAFSCQPFAFVGSLFVPMTGWVCQWKPFGIPVDDSYKKANVEDWVFQITDPSHDPHVNA